MAKKIVQYFAKELPSGISGEVQQPLKPEPAYKPQMIDKSMQYVSTALNDLAETAIIIENHNEALIGNKKLNDFDIEMTNKMIEMKKSIQGEAALKFGDNPGFTKTYEAWAKERLEDIANNSGLSPWAADALRKTGLSSITTKIHLAANYELEQKETVANQNILYASTRIKNDIKAGVVTNDQEFDKRIGQLWGVIDLNKPGSTALKELERERLQEYRIQFDKQNQERIAYVGITNKYTDAFGVLDYIAAAKDAVNPNLPENKNLSVNQMQNNQHAFMSQHIIKQKEDEPRMDKIVNLIDSRKINSVDELIKLPEYQGLLSDHKRVMSNMVDQKIRSDMAELRYQRQEQRQDWQDNANAVYDKIMGNIADGKYTDVKQIYSELTEASKKDGNNPFITKKFRDVAATFNVIQNSPDLKDGIKRINEAEKTGIFTQLNKDNPSGAAQDMRSKLRDLYMTDKEFRGDKIKQYLDTELKTKSKSGIGALLNKVFIPQSHAEVDAINNQYGGKAAPPDTVTVNGSTYKVGDTYNGYKYIGGGKWEK